MSVKNLSNELACCALRVKGSRTDCERFRHIPDFLPFAVIPGETQDRRSNHCVEERDYFVCPESPVLSKSADRKG
jgi:hypothetical protein